MGKRSLHEADITLPARLEKTENWGVEKHPKRGACLFFASARRRLIIQLHPWPQPVVKK